MKTTLKVTFAFALALLAGNLFASGNLRLNILPLNDEKAVVLISSLENSKLNITITNDKGEMVYYHENEGQTGSYRKVYNFSDLENGTYTMKVVSNDLTTERQIQKVKNRILVGDEKTTLKPFFGVDDHIFRCSYMNFTNDRVIFHLYRDSEEIYTKDKGTDFNIRHALNLSKLNKGSYEAVLTAGNKQFSYNVEVK